MNQHFRRSEDAHPTFPIRAFGRLDHVEVAEVGNMALVAFDLVDADDIAFAAGTDPCFRIDGDLASLQLAWEDWWDRRDAVRRSSSPFETIRLYRLEVELQLGTSWFGSVPIPRSTDDESYAVAIGALEGEWFEFTISPNMGLVAGNVYPALFSAPTPVRVTGTMPSVHEGRALSGIFSLANLPSLSTRGVAGLLSNVEADFLAAYDVGQGNANALLSMSPTLYYDLGAGVYRNKHTTPAGLVFCFTQDPVIVLSHWDADHWAGTYATEVGGRYPATERTWVAPFQTVGPVHVAFAHEVISNGGTFYTYSAPAGTTGIKTLSGGRRLRFILGAGGDRNGTGIVIAVENDGLPSPRSWLLTGDCDYRHFMSALAPFPPIAMVAPHHGANLDPATVVPRPVAGSLYRRLVYSFGAQNRHGKVQHPTTNAVTKHQTAGWDHGVWPFSGPGKPLPGGDVLATCEHPPGLKRGGALVGWSSAPVIAAAPCGGSSCTINPIQA